MFLTNELMVIGHVIQQCYMYMIEIAALFLHKENRQVMFLVIYKNSTAKYFVTSIEYLVLCLSGRGWHELQAFAITE